jgi:hypothetical protein
MGRRRRCDCEGEIGMPRLAPEMAAGGSSSGLSLLGVGAVVAHIAQVWRAGCSHTAFRLPRLPTLAPE